MKVALGSDHAGFGLKEELKKRLAKRLEAEFLDFGAFGSAQADYPDHGFPAAQAVASGSCAFGILVCGSGIGMSIVANKVKGIRAALCLDTESARLAREHNDANVLVLVGRKTSAELAEEIALVFLQTPFSGEERHARRISKIKKFEDEHLP
ncbi:ribose 5-phosphate isomerase B [Candidatus Micrarchaeota archaeon]|nr:ribose 5-phosphate isomerase B [Candidatus Micrarchaeota archaeon]